ncbi:MAG: DMT family transporter [Proteobacteria bacterium]|nr:DMT family transporter [Pseudomonadota bacterium]
MKPMISYLPSEAPMPENQEPSIWAALAIAGLCVSFGANATAIKISLTGVGVFTTAGIRFTMASMAIAIWAYVTGRSFALKKGQFKIVALITCLFIGQISLFYMGLKYTHASRGTLLANLQPFFVLILAHFMIPGDRITLKKTVGILCGFAGVAFMFLQKEGITKDLRTGDLLALSSVLLWAVNAVYTKKILSGFRPFHLVLYPGMLAVPVFFLEGMIWDSPMIIGLTPHILMALLYQGLVTASFGFVLWMHFLNRYGAVSMHSFIFILPMSGVFFGGLILKEPVVTSHMVLSLGFIMTGIFIVHSKGFKKRS